MAIAIDYPEVGSEYSRLNDVGRVTYLAGTRALNAFQLRLKAKHHTRSSSITLAKVIELAPKRPKDPPLMLNLPGSGDKDIDFVADHLGGMLRSFYSQSAIS